MSQTNNFRSEKSVHVGGSVSGSIVSAGDHNVQTITTVEPNNQQQAVEAALTEIAAALDRLSGPYGAIAADNARATTAEVAKPEPDKATIGARLEIALEAAKKTAELGGMVAKLGPQVATVAAWLGNSWQHLGHLI